MPSILLVSCQFPPDINVGAKRALRMAEHLARLGWRVQVLTVHDRYLDARDESLVAPNEPFERLRTHAFLPKRWLRRVKRWKKGAAGDDPVEISPGPGTPARRESVWDRVSFAWDVAFSIPDEWIGWLPGAIVGTLCHRSRPDLILATQPPPTNAVVAACLAKILRVPLVLDYRDPWSTLLRNAAIPRWRQHLDRGLETWCLRRTSLVIAVTGSIERDLAPVRPAMVVVVPNAYDPGVFERVVPTRFPRFTIVYAGNLYATRTAEPVLEALRLLRDRGRLPAGGVSLRVIGTTVSQVLGQVARLGLGQHVELEAFLPYHEALARMKGADVLLLLVGASHEGLIPAKLFDYLGARRFILAVAPAGAEAAKLVTELGVGRCVEPADVEGIAGALAERFAAAAEDLAPPAAASRFTVEATMKDLDRHLRQVLEKR